MHRKIITPSSTSKRLKSTIGCTSPWLVFGLTVLVMGGCEINHVEHQLERVKTSLLVPHTYIVAHKEVPIGTYVRFGNVTSSGAYEFHTSLNMPSTNGLTLTTETVYQFETRTFSPLKNITRTTSTANVDSPYQVEQLYPPVDGTGYTLSDSLSESPYHLRDFFGLELALMDKTASKTGELINVAQPILEFSNSTAWQVKDRHGGRVTLENSEGDSAIYEITQGLPRLKQMHDSEHLTITWIPYEDFEDIELHPLHVINDIHIPVEPPIDSPRTVSSLVLKFIFKDGDVGPWESLLDEEHTLTTSTRVTTPVQQFLDAARVIHDPKTKQKLRSIVAAISRDNDDPNEVVDDLVSYIHRTITYEYRRTLQSVAETLRHQLGDCTEFAQLFTALADAGNLSARTVVGLAYHEASRTFGIHAWNEVLLEDGSIRVVDPTWNQQNADATRIEFPPAFQYEIVQSLTNLRFEVHGETHDLDE